jgi:hypothetical protein
MRCANRDCNAMADDLMSGSLKLMEFEMDPGDRLLHAAGGFPICIARTRYFWLCERCSRKLTISRWNSSGVILEGLPGRGAPDRKPSSQERHVVNRRGGMYGAA